MDAITFNVISQAHFDRIRDEVRQETGMEITGNKGSSSAHGFTVSWEYVPETQCLTVQCTEKPWVIPASVVQGKLNEIVQDTQLN